MQMCRRRRVDLADWSSMFGVDFGAALLGGKWFLFFFFFLNDPAPTEFYPLPLPAALRILLVGLVVGVGLSLMVARALASLLLGVNAIDPASFASASLLLAAVAFIGSYLPARRASRFDRSEEHTSELQSQSNLVCRLLLEKQ